MKKRIAYVGLSSPIIYDYGNLAKQTKNDDSSSPNPILESPFGLMLLYDEIWFLCESLCPNNMRQLPYVKFIDKFMTEIEYSTITHIKIEEDLSWIDNNVNPLKSFSEQIANLNIEKITNITDNHTHQLKIGNDFKTWASSASIDLLFYDICMVEFISEYLYEKIELITNSFTNRFFIYDQVKTSNALQLVEKLTVNNIPNYNTKKGPYHPCIDEAREDSYLKAFRNWIMESHAQIDKSEIADVVADVENAINKAKDNQFEKYLNTSTYYKSIGETVVGALVDIFFPYSSLIKSIKGSLRDRKTAAKYQWQGFVSRAQNKYFSSSSI